MNKGCSIGEGAMVEGSIFFEGASVGEGAIVRNSILGPGATLAGNTIVRGFSVLGARCVVEEDNVLDHGARLNPGVRVSQGGISFWGHYYDTHRFETGRERRTMIIDQAPRTVKVEKPWAYFEPFTRNALSTVKIITVDPGGTLSLQYHHRRDELWVIVDSGAQVELGERVIQPEPGEKVFIPRRTPHRVSAIENTAVRILEVSFGEFDEDDIVRVEDVYGRAGSPTL